MLFPSGSFGLHCYTLELATLKLFTGGFRAPSVEAAKAPTIDGLVALLSPFNKWLTARERGGHFKSRCGQMLLRLVLALESTDLD
jgi:hypothetical protein